MIPSGPFVQTEYLRPYLELNLRFCERADIVTSIFSRRRITIISSERSSLQQMRGAREGRVLSQTLLSPLWTAQGHLIRRILELARPTPILHDFRSKLFKLL